MTTKDTTIMVKDLPADWAKEYIGKHYGSLRVTGTKEALQARLRVVCKVCKKKRVMGLNSVISNTDENCTCVVKRDVKDFIGKRYGNVIVIGKAAKNKKGLTVDCKCDCGNVFQSELKDLERGRNKQCPSCRTLNSVDHIGKTYNKILIIDAAPKDAVTHNTMVKCKCINIVKGVECGKVFTESLSAVIRGKRKSCGCLRSIYTKERAKELDETYDIWRQMMERCNNPKHVRYEGYGARGIKVCDEWYDREVYNDWYVANRPKDESIDWSVDRIDNDGGYSPENCKFSTKREQSVNQGIRKDNTTGYKGITKVDEKFRGNVKINGIEKAKQGFKTKEHAVMYRNFLIVSDCIGKEIHTPIQGIKRMLYPRVLNEKLSCIQWEYNGSIQSSVYHAPDVVERTIKLMLEDDNKNEN